MLAVRRVGESIAPPVVGLGALLSREDNAANERLGRS